MIEINKNNYKDISAGKTEGRHLRSGLISDVDRDLMEGIEGEDLTKLINVVSSATVIYFTSVAAVIGVAAYIAKRLRKTK